ncbi:prolipoprotein diacylglyceryl transferase [Roseovarius sp. SCSIO 43702]|uniref:prolipoprotein diacylglyceryl transferase n=1 Tax=Roseovarius sp. SCSIO 43702 TaxID=2823043 RepID=UPI001C730073|nr:prolipoprotein diacylglyceryl transferase [Roseovarius sp. SCSIO 43702]QYX58522.1 prolipoprotein diacylglyceryl transferase [Roseovarius sp. SCSIO 43702]
MMAAIPFPDISSEIVSFSLFGTEFALRWYAMAYVVSLALGWWLVVKSLRHPELWPDDTPPMTRGQADDLLTWVIVGVILGGRLGYVLFYQPAYYLAHPAEILMVWEGGMSFHGGFLGVMLACVIYWRRHDIPVLTGADALAAVTPVGMLLGRLANFVNAELWGRPTDLPWGVIFPGAAAQDCPLVTGLCARHPSQLYEALLEGALLLALLMWLAWRRGAFKYPGLITGLFIMGYGLARFAVEFVRQPDAQFVSPGNPLGLAWHVSGYGLTMGQILSIPMIALGLFLVLRARRAGRA